MYSELGEKIKLIRKRRDLNQDDLAEVLELSRSQISNLESGRRNLSVKQLEKLCEYFKVDMSYFLMFESKELTNIQKEDLFTSIMKIYLDSKENN